MANCILKDEAKKKVVYEFKNDISNIIKTNLQK